MAAPDRAYAFAKARILDGRFPGGTLITEGRVAAASDLSRTPVREAFARLAAEAAQDLSQARRPGRPGVGGRG